MDQWLYSFVCTSHFSLSSLWKCIWQHLIFKMLVRYILWSVCLRLSQFSQLSYMQYIELSAFSIPILLWWLWWLFSQNTLSNNDHQIRSMNHLPIKQWYTLYVFLFLYCNYCNDISTQYSSLLCSCNNTFLHCRNIICRIATGQWPCCHSVHHNSRPIVPDGLLWLTDK